LIPTKADNSRQSMIDTHQQANNQHVNEELRRLHISMKQKETLISKVKTIVNDEEEPDKIGKISKLFGKTTAD
jgi:hypothetical protein